MADQSTPVESQPQIMVVDISAASVPAPAPAPTSPISTLVPHPEKLSFRTVDNVIKMMYSDPNTVRSTALDILAIYLKGQKILYTEAKTFCERRLYTLMVPATVVTAACTLLSVQLKDYEHGAIIVAVLNAFNSLLLTLVTLLKLDAKAEAHKIAAYKYDKLQSFCEFKSGKILFLKDEKDSVNDIIDEIESKVKEIKETNQFILPENVRYMFRFTYGQNVFATVKEIQNEEMMLTNRLKGTINALLTVHATQPLNTARVLELEAKQNGTIDALLHLRDKYLNIDSPFEQEIGEQIRRSRKDWICCLTWLNT